MSQAEVIAVCRDGLHRFSKAPVDRITLIEGLGVEGDAHAGTRVQHRSRVRRNPDQPNLRQVHLLHREPFDDARDQGYVLSPGDLGENILTEGLDILSLPEGTVLEIGDTAVVRLTGLRNPCRQINDFRPGLLKVVLARENGTPRDEPAPSTASPQAQSTPLIRKAGVMSVVQRGGSVSAGDPITVKLPPAPHHPLAPV